MARLGLASGSRYWPETCFLSNPESFGQKPSDGPSKAATSKDISSADGSPAVKAGGGSPAAKAGGGDNGEDIAALAKGGRTNIFGFLLRLAARLPFLFIAGRIYGAAALGRFAYAILIVEFAAQLATLGLKRGLAEQLSQT